MPQKRSRRLKDHRELEQLAQHDPNNKDIYEESLLDTLSQETGESGRRLSLRLGGQLLLAKY